MWTAYEQKEMNMKGMNRQQTVLFWVGAGLAIGAGVGMVVFDALLPGILIGMILGVVVGALVARER
jgi:hypothetical protein